MIDRKSVVCVAVLLGGMVSSSQAAAQNPVVTPVPPVPAVGVPAKAEAVRSSYVLGPDDQITIRIADVPEINDKPQRLDPNGDLRLPMLGRVHAAGMTVEQLEAELTKRLAEFLQEPDVSVVVNEFRSQPVSVIGAVVTPGIRQLDGRKTLVEVLSLAGGLSAEAGPYLRVARRLDQGRIPLAEATDEPSGAFSVVEIDARALLESRTPEKNIVLKPFDVISVPRADLVYVIGEVGKPGPVALNGGKSISIIEAVSSSGGVLRTAAPSRVRVLRRVQGDGKRAEINVDLQKVMQGKAEDIQLAAGDILVVPDSSGKRIAVRAIDAAIQVGTMIIGYGIIR